MSLIATDQLLEATGLPKACLRPLAACSAVAITCLPCPVPDAGVR